MSLLETRLSSNAFSAGAATLYMPYAVNTEIYRPLEGVAEIYDVGFIGNVKVKEREERIGLIRRNYCSFIGNNLYMDEANRKLNECMIIFNTSDWKEINMRVFEALATGKLLVTEKVDHLDELFTDGIHLVTYRDNDELLEKITYYLEHESARRRIAENGLAVVKRYHSYRHRAMFIAQKIEQERLVSGQFDRPHVRNGRAFRCFYEKQATENKLAQERIFDFGIPDPDTGGKYNIRARLSEALHVAKGKVLDIGCQRGGYCYNLKVRGFDVVGMDISIGYLQMARSKVAGVALTAGDAQALPFRDRSFNTVILSEVLEHVIDEKAVVSEVSRVLKESGIVYVTVPAYLEGTEEHVRFLSKKSLMELFGEFRIEFRDNFSVQSTLMVATKPPEMLQAVVATGSAVLCRPQ